MDVTTYPAPPTTPVPPSPVPTPPQRRYRWQIILPVILLTGSVVFLGGTYAFKTNDVPIPPTPTVPEPIQTIASQPAPPTPPAAPAPVAPPSVIPPLPSQKPQDHASPPRQSPDGVDVSVPRIEIPPPVGFAPSDPPSTTRKTHEGKSFADLLKNPPRPRQNPTKVPRFSLSPNSRAVFSRYKNYSDATSLLLYLPKLFPPASTAKAEEEIRFFLHNAAPLSSHLLRTPANPHVRIVLTLHWRKDACVAYGLHYREDEQQGEQATGIAVACAP